jgi:hypothetical protein
MESESKAWTNCNPVESLQDDLMATLIPNDVEEFQTE